ncbi:hypothetical protein PIROE2DRAFT_44650, partial [Piromyces sp. E2]
MIDINAEANNKSSALSYACHCHHNSIVKYLLEHGADIYNRNNKGETPLLIAIKNNYIDLVKLLIEYGANP